jgi:hypothetical protein
VSAFGQHFVAIPRSSLRIATFVPYSEHFVAIAAAALAVATKCTLIAAGLLDAPG